MDNEAVTCRLCGAGSIRCLGTLPDGDYFAGRVLQNPIDGGRLWACDACESMFRHPVLPSSTYLRLYTDGAGDEWRADDGRRDFEIVRLIVGQIADHGSVLDVGCGAGDFLLTLPADIKRYGVEPSAAAASAARNSGVSILAASLEDVSPETRFDVITMIDVIEHVADPRAMLDAALHHLAPDGALIVSTGDAENVLWRRIFRSRFWYSSFPEHITFPSLRYFDIWRAGKGLRAPCAVKIRYRHLSSWKAALSLASQMAYFASPWLLNCVSRCIAWLRRSPGAQRRFYSPGAPGVFADHQVVTMQRLR